MRPLIGISLSLDEAGRRHPTRETARLDTRYARAVEEAGATPVLLPIQDDVAALVTRLSGLLIPGGRDFAPPRPYPPEVRFDLVPPALLAFDTRLLAAALERGLPVFGICYGMQLLALAGGGSLVFDIASDVPLSGTHRLPESDARHGLAIEPGSRLAGLLGDAAEAVNSHHHQGVAAVGRGQRISARADDGLIEAIEGVGEGFSLGVQWHPERMPDPHRERLFGGFVAACRAHGRGRG